MLSKTPLRILLLDVHELAGLGAARSLGRAGHRVIGVCPDDAPLPAAALSRYVAEVRRCPHPFRRQLAYQGWLRALLAREGFDIVLPISEASLLAVAALRQHAHATGALPVLPNEAGLRVALSKYHATQAARGLGVPTPRTAFLCPASPTGDAPWDWDAPGGVPAAAARLAELLAQAGLRYPLIVKSDNHLCAAGEYHKGRALRVTEPGEALSALAELHEHGAAVIAQQIIPGHGAGAFLLRQGDATLLRFAHRRLHEVPYSGGVSSFRESVHDAALLAHAERLLAGLRYEGVAMVEFRRGEDGVPYFLEVNGRLWGSLALALHAGVDFPLALVEAARRAAAPQRPPRRLRLVPLHATPGEDLAGGARGAAVVARDAPSAAAYPQGVRCRNVFPGEILHLLSVLGAPDHALPRRRKAQALWTFLRLSLDPRVHHDYLWRDDPLPAVLQAARVTFETAGRLLGRGRSRLTRRAERAALAQAPPWRTLMLALSARSALAPRPTQVLFLCHGNICRSPYAAVYFNQRAREGAAPLRADSAGLRAQPGQRTPLRFRVLTRALGPAREGRGPAVPFGDDAVVDLTPHRARAVTDADIARADLILVMDGANYRDLLRRHPGAHPKVFPLGALRAQGAPPGTAEEKPEQERPEIPDPYLASPPDARASYQALRDAVDLLLAALTAGAAQRSAPPAPPATPLASPPAPPLAWSLSKARRL